MTAEVARDMRRSKTAFESLVWPVVRELIGGGELLSMEDQAHDRLRTLFDTQTGIDAWQYRDGFGMYGIASRVQPSHKDWSTFTLRVARNNCTRTEAQKLWEAVNAGDGRVYPKWFVHAYTTGRSESLLSVGVCETRAVLECWRSGLGEVRRCENAEFFAMKWDQMAKAGWTVHVWRATDGR